MRMARKAAKGWAFGIAALLILWAHACGDDGGNGDGASGAPAPPPELGEPCTRTCAAGTCERSGAFAGLCTAQCNSDPACQLGSSAQGPVGCIRNRCARLCTAPTDCPTDTACTEVDGRMACAPAATAQ